MPLSFTIFFSGRPDTNSTVLITFKKLNHFLAEFIFQAFDSGFYAINSGEFASEVVAYLISKISCPKLSLVSQTDVQGFVSDYRIHTVVIPHWDLSIVMDIWIQEFIWLKVGSIQLLLLELKSRARRRWRFNYSVSCLVYCLRMEHPYRISKRSHNYISIWQLIF